MSELEKHKSKMLVKRGGEKIRAVGYIVTIKEEYECTYYISATSTKELKKKLKKRIDEIDYDEYICTGNEIESVEIEKVASVPINIHKSNNICQEKTQVNRSYIKGKI